MKDGFGREIKAGDVVVVCNRSGGSQWLKEYVVIATDENRVEAIFTRSTCSWETNKTKRNVWLRTPRSTIIVGSLINDNEEFLNDPNIGTEEDAENGKWWLVKMKSSLVDMLMSKK